MKVLFVVNPKSGNRNEDDIENRLSSFAIKQSFDYLIFHTEETGNSQKINNLIKEFQPSTVVVAGGDGTINLVASLLIKHNINLGIVPTGSANGLAYNLSIPKNVEKSLEKLVDKNPKPVDAILLNEKYHCFHLSDTGINARVVKRFEKQDSKGLAGYGKQLIKEMISSNTAFRVRLIIKGLSKNMKAEMVIIANAKSFGTGAKINPIGDLKDGKFEIVVIKPYPWWFVFRIVISFFTGNLHKLQNVRIYSTNKARLTFNEPQDLQIDGELVEGISTLNVRIIPGALKVFY